MVIKMYIRKAKLSDLDRIMEIYASARIFMTQNGNPRQWAANSWPPETLIKEDIKSQKCYVCIDEDKVVGVFFFDKGKDVEPCYKSIQGGNWCGQDEYGVVHRIASDMSKKGIGKFCLNYAFDICKNLRIDTHEDNKPMQNLLHSLGFKYRGIIYVPEDTEPRLAYEKT